MNLKMALIFWAVLAGLVVTAVSASAQTIAYRQTNLSSDVNTPGFANHTNLFLRNSWGVAFQPRQPFFIANTGNGRVVVLDATGAPAAPGVFHVPNLVGHAFGTATAVAADANSFFGGGELIQPFIVATQDGGIFVWGVDANGKVPQSATLAVAHSPLGAVYTGLAILTPSCCAPFLAVANFHSGFLLRRLASVMNGN
jgi:hypothetical protein